MENSSKKIKLKHIIEFLEDIETFSNPKEELEQYQTNAQIAGEMMHYIYNNNINDFDLMNIIDLGCGTGILGIAAAYCGCR
jgi:predicted RNA methylase